MSDSFIQVIAIALLLGIGMISFSTVGFSYRVYLNKLVWDGIPKRLFLIGLIVTILSGIILLFI